MAQLILSKEAKSIGAAAWQVESMAGGQHILPASRIKRLVRAYKRRPSWFLQQAELRQNRPDWHQFLHEIEEREIANKRILEAFEAQATQAARVAEDFFKAMNSNSLTEQMLRLTASCPQLDQMASRMSNLTRQAEEQASSMSRALDQLVGVRRLRSTN